MVGCGPSLTGHSVGKVVTIEATNTALGGLYLVNLISTEVVLGEMNEGMNGMNFPVVVHNLRDLRFGNKGSLMVQNCKTAQTSDDRKL